ncbi:MAG: lysophospholipase [Pirellulaceae bacterium]
MNPLRYQATRERLGSLDCVIISPETVEPIAGLAVFCHGFGAGGDDLVGLAGELLQVAAPQKPLVMVFPAAPLSLADQGMPGARAWWLLSIQRLMNALEEGRYEQVREEVPDGIEEARTALVESIEAAMQRYDVDESRLLLGGFSQGAMLSVETACLGLKQPPRQLCLFSGALICERRWRPVMPRLRDTKIFQSHGSTDMVLPLQTGLWLRDALTESECRVEFCQFAGPHTIPLEALEHSGKMLAELAMC